MATKFSDFTAQAATATAFVVGYDGTTNTQYSQTQLTDFVFDGALSGNTTLSMGNHNIAFNSTAATNSSGNFTFNGTYTSTAGGVGVAGGGFLIGGGYGTRLKSTYLQIYSGAVLQGTSSGFLTIHNTVSNNAAYSINARLGIVGKHNDNTSYALRVQNSDNDELMQVRNDGAIAIGKGASCTSSTPNTSVIIGTSALATSNNSVVIGASATTGSGGNFNTLVGATAKVSNNTSFGISIGYGAEGTGTNSVAIGYSSKAAGNGLAIGRDAEATGSKSITLSASGGISQNTTANTFDVYMSSTSTPDFKVIGNEGMIPPSITTTVRNAISSPVTGSTIYNTTDNKLQFYNGSAWTDAAGGDNIYTADGTLAGNRNVNLGTNNLGFTNGKVGVGLASPLYTFETRATVAGNWVSRIMNESSTGYGLLVRVNNASSNITFATHNGNGYTTAFHGTGEVGIGTATNVPSAKLHVKGSGTTSATTAFLIENATSPILTIKDNGIFALGIGSSSTDPRAVAIGEGATASNTFDICIGTGTASGGNSIAIGRASSSGADAIAMGTGASSGANGVAMGQVSTATGTGVAIGLASKAPTSSIGLGALAKGTGANSITLNASGSDVTPSTANEFGVYMTSNTTPDFKVIGAQGMVPPSITTTVRDAISSPASGSTIYNTTDNKLQFYNGSAWTDAGGGSSSSIYTADGTLSGARTVTVPNGGSITFSSGPSNQNNLFSFNIDSIYIANTGTIRVPINGQFSINSYSTKLYQNYLQLYGGNGPKLNGTANGFLTVSNTTGTSYSINARLGVIGKSTTSTTDYAFRVQQSDNTDLLTLRDDGAFALGKSASPQGASAVTIGELAETTVSTSIAIGYNSEAAGGIAIGSNADNNQAFSQCIGGNTSNAAQYQTVIGYDADGLSGADRSIAIGASAKAHAQGGIAIGVGANAQNHCIVLGRNVGVSGTPDNSVVFSTRGGNNITYSEADSFTWYNTSNTVPDLKFKPGSDSYWNSSGNFGFGITNPTDRLQVPTSIGIIGDSTNAGKLKLYCEAGTAHHVAIEGPAHSGGSTYTIKLPASAPSAGQVLASDANGNLSWKSPHQLDFSGLPTSDPGQEGKLYRDSEGLIYVSIP